MKLSIVIVNYNVKFFIEQCLYSVFRSLKGIDGEVIVVDNNSVDGSEAMIRDRFPEVKLFCNKQNVGFSKATNAGIREAKGEYILCLNPDTVVEESTFKKCLDFMDKNPDAGGLGPKMIDGRGNYLPESKRGLPTLKVAFFKITGLSRLFPKSPVFARYYLGHLPINETHKIEILTGSFMFLRKSVLEKVGLFDEQFFMYGEDIDLSYRILKAGYTNYYLSETTIIHYRGESTRKSSINYVLVFYKAMKIFTQKHFSNNSASVLTFLITLAINFRAFLSIIKRTLIQITPIILDAITFYGTILFITSIWEKIYLESSNLYPSQFRFFIIPAFILIWIVSLLLSRSYQHPIKVKKIINGILIGSLINLVIYALVPGEYRFSRAILLIGSASVLVIAIINRFLLSLTGIREYLLILKNNKRFAIVGYEDETERVKTILQKSGIVPEHIEFVFPLENETHANYSCNISNLVEIVLVQKIDEVIFCAKDISAQDIIKNMKILSKSDIDFKIASPESISVIGSNSTKAAGDLYVIKIDNIKN